MFRLHKEVKVNTPIPRDHNGLVSSVQVLKEGQVEKVSVDVDIKHANPNDIQLELVGPNGKSIVLQAKGANNDAGAPTPFKKSFSGTVLNSIQGNSSKGKWKLIAKNHSNKNTSVLNHWSLNMDCKPGANSKNEIFTNHAKAETLVSEQYCRLNGSVRAMKVFVDIDHPNKKELVVKLSSPSGKSIVLHDKAGEGKFVATTFDTHTTKNLSGERTNGTWKLSVQDFDGNTKVGKLRKWKLFMDYDPIDSLMNIKGVDTNAQRALESAGINSYSKLASSTPNKIKEILETAKVNLKGINIDQLREQAKEAIENYVA